MLELVVGYPGGGGSKGERERGDVLSTEYVG